MRSYGAWNSPRTVLPGSETSVSGGSRGTLAQLFKDMVADALQMLFMTIKPLMVSSNPSSGAQEVP